MPAPETNVRKPFLPGRVVALRSRTARGRVIRICKTFGDAARLGFGSPLVGRHHRVSNRDLLELLYSVGSYAKHPARKTAFVSDRNGSTHHETHQALLVLVEL